MFALLHKLKQKEDEFTWLLAALFTLILAMFVNIWFLSFLIYGLTLRSLGYKPKYFIFGPNATKLPIGIVRDAVTNQPVPLAIVRLYARSSQRLLQTRVTNRDGAFEFLLPTGTYFIDVCKNGYHFPSKINRLGYEGQEIRVSNDLRYYLFQDEIYLDPRKSNFSAKIEPIPVQAAQQVNISAQQKAYSVNID